MLGASLGPASNAVACSRLRAGDGFDESAFPSAETAGNIIAVPGDQLDTSGRSGLIM